jgi:hypothetical protein
MQLLLQADLLSQIGPIIRTASVAPGMPPTVPASPAKQSTMTTSINQSGKSNQRYSCSNEIHGGIHARH